MKMKLFHGTNLVIEKPVIVNRFKTLDFGEGFYTTKNLCSLVYNPGGVAQQSEGLRVFAPPWKCHANNNQPRRGCLFPGLSCVKWATLPGLMIFSYSTSRVARIRATLRFVGKPLRGCHASLPFWDVENPKAEARASLPHSEISR